MNFWKRHIGDYVRSASHLSLLEHGILVRLLDCYYVRESGIPDDLAARLIGARAKDELQALKTVLNEFFYLADSFWIQDRCEREISAASAKASANKKNGALGGRPRRSESKKMQASDARASSTGPTLILGGSELKPTNYPDGFETRPTDNLSQTPDSRLQDLKASDTSLRSVSGGEPPHVEPRTKEELWRAGKSLLTQAGMPAAQCGTFIGKLVKDYDADIALEAVRATVVERPADPASYLRATCQRMAGERTSPRSGRPSSNDFGTNPMPVFIDPFEKVAI